MSSRIEDYALIGDCHTAALVGKDSSIDWLCLPRFDSPACFAALLGLPEHGRWLLSPVGGIRRVTRRYRPETLILETDFETDQGEVTLIDFMPPRMKEPELLRIVVGKRGRVSMRMELIVRFDYGSIIPWVQKVPGGIHALAGPDTLVVHARVPMRGENWTTVAEFDVLPGQREPFVLAWYPMHGPTPRRIDADRALEYVEEWWRSWSGQCTYHGCWRDAVLRSLMTLKALTYAPTGGMVAAATTSLPEKIGGVRNWDYRYCWVRDATLTLYALMTGGFHDEARAWRQWLLRTVAGTPSQVNIMYGLRGERRLTELELDWLPGYENSRPVRTGNAAHRQFQLDIFGEIMDMLYLAHRTGLPPDENACRVQEAMMEHLESVWRLPDQGIWEVRGPERHFTHSKVMAWTAMDRAIRAVEAYGLEGPVERWKTLRDAIHAEVCQNGYDPQRNTFVQYYGGQSLDASLLMIPMVGFLPPSDPRVRGTVEAVERQLIHDGFVLRYPSEPGIDGLPPGEGVFLACTFWLADCQAMLGRTDDAVRTFKRLLSLCNDVGLLSEQYDPQTNRLVGNFPQAFSHVGLINTASRLAREAAPNRERSRADRTQ